VQDAPGPIGLRIHREVEAAVSGQHEVAGGVTIPFNIDRKEKSYDAGRRELKQGTLVDMAAGGSQAIKVAVRSLNQACDRASNRAATLGAECIQSGDGSSTSELEDDDGTGLPFGGSIQVAILALQKIGGILAVGAREAIERKKLPLGVDVEYRAATRGAGRVACHPVWFRTVSDPWLGSGYWEMRHRRR